LNLSTKNWEFPGICSRNFKGFFFFLFKHSRFLPPTTADMIRYHNNVYNRNLIAQQKSTKQNISSSQRTRAACPFNKSSYSSIRRVTTSMRVYYKPNPIISNRTFSNKDTSSPPNQAGDFDWEKYTNSSSSRYRF